MIANRDPNFGPLAPDTQKFYDGILAAAKVKDPAAYFDWSPGSIPYLCYSGVQLLITYPMREAALKMGQTPADALNGVITPSARLAWQQENLIALEGSARTAVSGGPELLEYIERLKAFWETAAGQGIDLNAPPEVPANVPAVDPPVAVPLKPLTWPFA